MTTIVYRDGILAADRLVSNGDWIVPYGETKIGRLPLRGLWALSGDVKHRRSVIAFLEKCEATPEGVGDPPDLKDEARALWIRPDGTTWLLEGASVRSISAPFIVLGSGIPPALGALHSGATAIEAVRCAARVDPWTGGGVDWLELEKTGEVFHSDLV